MNEKYTEGSRWASDHFEEASTPPEEGTLAAFRIPSGWIIGQVLDVTSMGVRFKVTDRSKSTTTIVNSEEWALLPSEEVTEPKIQFATPLEAVHALLGAGLVQYVETRKRTYIHLDCEWTHEMDAEVVRLLETETLRKTGLSKLTPEERAALGL